MSALEKERRTIKRRLRRRSKDSPRSWLFSDSAAMDLRPLASPGRSQDRSVLGIFGAGFKAESPEDSEGDAEASYGYFCEKFVSWSWGICRI